MAIYCTMSEQDQLIVTLKNELSAAVYSYLAVVHSKLESDINSDAAVDVLVTVLSLNLGHILGQLEPEYRTSTLEMSTRLILDQITEVSKLTSISSHGQIGHA